MGSDNRPPRPLLSSLFHSFTFELLNSCTAFAFRVPQARSLCLGLGVASLHTLRLGACAPHAAFAHRSWGSPLVAQSLLTVLLGFRNHTTGPMNLRVPHPSRLPAKGGLRRSNTSASLLSQGPLRNSSPFSSRRIATASGPANNIFLECSNATCADDLIAGNPRLSFKCPSDTPPTPAVPPRQSATHACLKPL